MFTRAPLTRGVLVVSTGLSALLIILRLVELVHFPSVNPYLFPSLQIWRPITNMAFFNVSLVDFIFSSILLLEFRTIEQRLGTSKYAGFLIFSTLFSLTLQIIAMNSLGITNIPGPYGWIFACATFWAFSIPPLDPVNFMAFQLSNKIYYYILCLLIFLVVPTGGKFLCIFGSLAGLVYYLNFFGVQRLRSPEFINRLAEKYIAPLLAIDTHHYNSLRDIQNIRLYELMNRRLTYYYRQTPPPLVRVPQGQGHQHQPHQHHHQHNHNQPIIQPNLPNANFVRRSTGSLASPVPVRVSEDSISYLLEMGFSREEAKFALEQTGNNVELAMNILTDSN